MNITKILSIMFRWMVSVTNILITSREIGREDKRVILQGLKEIDDEMQKTHAREP